jgi:hypothetical protein
VEFATDETRVFVTVANGSSSQASFYDFNAKAVQGSKQFDPESFGSDYPEVQSEILAGVSSSGVIVFPAMSPSAQTSIYLEAGSDDFSVDFSPFVFTIPAR